MLPHLSASHQTGVGIYLPNRGISTAEWGDIAALGCTHAVDLHDFRDRWPWISLHLPGLHLHARINWRGAFRLSSQEADDIISIIRSNSRAVATWRVWNEPQLEIGCTPAEWEEHVVAVYSLVHEAIPEARLYIAAPSPGTSDFVAWVGACARAARRLADTRYPDGIGLDAHAYGNPAEVAHTLEVCRQAWQGPLLVSEHNFGAGRAYSLEQYAAELPQTLDVANRYGATALCVFIYDWANPDMGLPTPVNVKGNPVVYHAIQLLAAKVNNGGTVPIKTEADRYIADLWKRFGDIPYVVDQAFPSYYKAQWDRGRFLGAPLENAHWTEDKSVIYQAFSSGVILWAKPSEGWAVHEGTPPFAR